MVRHSDVLGPLGRRVITGLDTETGKAKVIYDDNGGFTAKVPNGNIKQTVWFTDEVPADCSDATSADPTGNKQFRIVNEGSVGTFVWIKGGASSPMHQTKSIDYGIILEGEVELILDSGEARILKSGDVIVQRETNHIWRNPHPTRWAKVFFIYVASTNAMALKN